LAVGGLKPAAPTMGLTLADATGLREAPGAI